MYKISHYSNTVCHDADLETAVDIAIAGAYANTGQSYIVKIIFSCKNIFTATVDLVHSFIARSTINFYKEL